VATAIRVAKARASCIRREIERVERWLEELHEAEIAGPGVGEADGEEDEDRDHDSRDSPTARVRAEHLANQRQRGRQRPRYCIALHLFHGAVLRLRRRLFHLQYCPGLRIPRGVHRHLHKVPRPPRSIALTLFLVMKKHAIQSEDA
jgi:hypothetical protein